MQSANPFRLACFRAVIMLLLAGPTMGMAPSNSDPYLVVLGIAQDGGFPQLGTPPGDAWKGEARRLVSCLGLVDPASGERWLFDATPDIAEQVQRLDLLAPRAPGAPVVNGILLTHAHIGHYTGLMALGREALGARDIPVHVMPRMQAFLAGNGPWSQLVELNNIRLLPLEANTPVQLNPRLSVIPLRVPHRDEYSETIGFLIAGPGARALYLPDIDKWERWDEAGTRLEEVLAGVDMAWIDGTFMEDGEIPGRAMAEIPHPFMVETMARIEARAPNLRERIQFIHLNRTNPALLRDALGPGNASPDELERRGFKVAREGDIWSLGKR
ncbi:MAG: MBL fold metallo-hydrolase [Steroidobacteraceae bacterium]